MVDSESLAKARKARQYLDKLAGLKNIDQSAILEELVRSGVPQNEIHPTLNNIHSEIIRDNYGIGGDSIKDIKKYYQNFDPNIDVRMNPKLKSYGAFESSLAGDKIRLNPNQDKYSILSSSDHELQHYDEIHPSLQKERPKLIKQLQKASDENKAFEKIRKKVTDITDQFGVPYGEMTPEKTLDQIELRKALANAPSSAVDELAPTATHFKQYPTSNYELAEVERGIVGNKRMRFGKLMKTLGPVAAVLGGAATALSSGDVMAGVADVAVPGGIEGLGQGSDSPSQLYDYERNEAAIQQAQEAQKDLDNLYKFRKLNRYMGE